MAKRKPVGGRLLRKSRLRRKNVKSMLWKIAEQIASLIPPERIQTWKAESDKAAKAFAKWVL